jgi:hypothetical protein
MTGYRASPSTDSIRVGRPQQSSAIGAGGGALWCPIVSRQACIAARKQAHREAIAWAQRIGLLRNQNERAWAAAWNVAEFAGRVYGEAENLCLAAEWILWMDIFDDAVESLAAEQIPQKVAPLTRILCSDNPIETPADAEPLVGALADLWMRTMVGMSPAWRARIAHAWQCCANGMSWEAANRATHRAPTLHDYIASRASAGGTYFALALTEGLYNYELPDTLHHSGPLSALRTLAGDQICWANDLLSLDREEHRGDVHNLVLVLEQDSGLTRREAIQETVRMTNERMRAISLIMTALPDYQHGTGLSASDSQLMNRSVDSIGQWVSGSLDFHRISTRHNDHRRQQLNPFRSPAPNVSP